MILFYIISVYTLHVNKKNLSFQCYQGVTSLLMPQKSCHAMHKKMEKKPYIVGPPGPLFTVQEPAAQVVSDSFLFLISYDIFITPSICDSRTQRY